MKTTVAILLLFTSVCSYSQSRDEIVQSKVKARLNEMMDGPSTYEFVSLTPSGTITHLHNIYVRTDEIKRQIESNELDLQMKLQYPDLLHSDADFEQIKSLKIEIDKDYAMLHEIHSVEKALANKVNTPVSYTYMLKLRAKDDAGAKAVSEYLVQVEASTLDIMNIASGAESVIAGFGDFPGYHELVAKSESMRRAVAGKAQAFVDSLRSNLKQSQVPSRTVSNTDGLEPVGTDSASDGKIYTVVEQQPEYKGGFEALVKFIRNNLQYPASAKSRGLEGTVYVGFVTTKDGSIEDVKVVSGLSAECDEEAVRLVKSMPKWIPGKRNGTTANVRVVVPIKFSGR